jgi:apolipoprotein N-acyltransferase
MMPALPGVAWTQPPAQSAVVLQPAIRDDEAWTRPLLDKRLEHMALRTLEVSLRVGQPKPEMLLWPEVPGPFYYYGDAHFRDLAARMARLAVSPFLFGSVAYTTRGEPLNSVVMLDEAGRLRARYDKMRLVPFGEFVPPLFGWISRVTGEAGDFQAGSRRVIFETGRGAAGVFICYESAFADHVRMFARDGATVLVNATNDGYFARTAARAQHLLLARMRAVENRRWLLRPSNDGATVSIAPDGSLASALKPFEETAGRLRYGHVREKTVYTRHGDWFAWGCLALGLAACAAATGWGEARFRA